MTNPVRADAPAGALKLVRMIVGSAVYPAVAFFGAGRVDWLRGWVYLVLFIAVTIAGISFVQRANPGLMDARSRWMRQDMKAFDKVFYALFIPLMAIYPLVAGLDAVRYSWAPLPAWSVWPGILLFLAGSALTTWAMVTNRFAEGTVRIQSERSHAAVTDGPYRFVRHPMYVGTIVGLPAVALVLGSAWALAPMVLIIVLFVWRTAMEDRTLQRELEGYADYVRATPYRLVPGIW